MKHEKKCLMAAETEHLKWKDDTLGVTERRASVLHRGGSRGFPQCGRSVGERKGPIRAINTAKHGQVKKKKITKQQNTENLNVKIQLNKSKCEANGVFICC